MHDLSHQMVCIHTRHKDAQLLLLMYNRQGLGTKQHALRHFIQQAVSALAMCKNASVLARHLQSSSSSNAAAAAHVKTKPPWQLRLHPVLAAHQAGHCA
jgi:hypothetical protein